MRCLEVQKKVVIDLYLDGLRKGLKIECLEIYLDNNFSATKVRLKILITST